MKTTAISIVVAAVLIGGVVMLSREGKNSNSTGSQVVNNVSVVDGKQIIMITAKGGYNPYVTMAQANIPTIIKMETQGTFDCSSALNIPSIGYRGYLQPSGTTEIKVSPQVSGTTLQGLCAMGMFNFQIHFK